MEKKQEIGCALRDAEAKGKLEIVSAVTLVPMERLNIYINDPDAILDVDAILLESHLN